MKTSITRLAGCVIIDSQDQILLIHRNKNGNVQWETPGGKIETGETPEQAAKRELKEELGLEVTLLSKIGESPFTEKDNNMHYVWFRAVIPQRETILLEDGFDEYRYFSLEDSKSYKLSAGTLQLLKLHQQGKIQILAPEKNSCKQQ